MVMFCLIVALLSLVCQYEFRPYKLDAMNTVKIMEAWQNLLCVVVLLIQDAHMFESEAMYDLAGAALLVVDVMMIGVMVWSAWKRGACRPGHLVEGLSMDQGDYQPPRIFDDERGHAAAAENEQLREQLQDRSSEVQQLREQLRIESEQSKAEVAELRRQLGDSKNS